MTTLASPSRLGDLVVAPRPRPVGLSLLVFCVAFGWHAWVGDQQRRRLQQGMDFTIFHQAVRALSEGESPWSAIKADNLWGDHFHPIIALLAPLYWLWDDPQVLVVAQAVALAASAAILTDTAIRVLRPGWGERPARAAALLLAAAFTVSPGVQGASTFDVHEVAFGAPLLAMACRALLLGRWRAVAAWTLGLLLVKEDAGLLVVGLALVCAVRGQRRLAAWLGATAVVWTVVVTRLVIPALSVHETWTYASTLGSVPDLITSSARAWLLPWHLPLTLTVLAVTGGWVAARSGLLLAVVPSLLARGPTATRRCGGWASTTTCCPRW